MPDILPDGVERMPGPCLVCGGRHDNCAATAVVQLPARDAAAAREQLECERVQATLPEGSFTTGTYRRPKKP